MILDFFFFDKWLYTKPSRPVLREWIYPDVPSGKLSHNYGKSPCLMGKSTISMAIFNSKLFVITRGYHFWSLHISAPTFCRMVVQARSLQASTKQLVRCWAKFRAAPVFGSGYMCQGSAGQGDWSLSGSNLRQEKHTSDVGWYHRNSN